MQIARKFAALMDWMQDAGETLTVAPGRFDDTPEATRGTQKHTGRSQLAAPRVLLPVPMG